MHNQYIKNMDRFDEFEYKDFFDDMGELSKMCEEYMKDPKIYERYATINDIIDELEKFPEKCIKMIKDIEKRIKDEKDTIKNKIKKRKGIFLYEHF